VMMDDGDFGGRWAGINGAVTTSVARSWVIVLIYLLFGGMMSSHGTKGLGFLLMGIEEGSFDGTRLLTSIIRRALYQCARVG
jgi:hypothetical protein